MNAPPQTSGRNNTPILQHLVRIYKFWHGFLPNLSQFARYTLGAKIDGALLETIEAVLFASFAAREKKLVYLERAAVKLDLVKFLMQVAWEVKALDNKKYVLISEELAGVGRMLGGWLKKYNQPPTAPKR